MKNILSFAAKNVTANRKRTLITIVTIVVGLCFINVGRGIMSGMQRESELSLTEGRTGEIQLHKRGYFDASELSNLSYSIPAYSQLQRELTDVEGVEYAAGRLQFGGMLAKEEELAVVVFCRAADVVNEVKVCPRILENIVEGRFLSKDETRGAVIASGLRKGIGANIGDLLIVVANTKDGFMNAIELEVIGIIEEKAAQANTRLVYMPMAKAQELLYMDDEVTEIVLKTSKDSDIDVLNGKLNHMFSGGGIESNTWKEVSAFFVDVMKKQDAVVFALCVIFYLIVISSITNTMMLTLWERKKEIGTMMALGIKGRHVIKLVVTESMIIGFVGSLIGILMSVLVITILSGTGLSYTPPQAASPVKIYPAIDLAFMFLSFVLGVLSSIAATIYPARKVLQVNPIDALRTT
ncbi:MAG: ABC transporter permease [Deltaproteobacteria bacterium]|nr:ABC transporter permease [Deltaproteobacteria bacterium]